MKYVLPLFVVIITVSEIFAKQLRFDNYKLYRLTPKDQDALNTLKQLEYATFSGYSFWSQVDNVGVPVDLMVPPNHVDDVEKMLQVSEMDGELILTNVQDQIDNEGFRPQARAGTFDWENYYTLEEINSWLESLAETYPDNVTLIRPGRTFEGREILGVKVSFGSGNEQRSVFMEANIHAREWITSAVNTYILNEFLTSTNESVRAVADYHDWYFFPVFNPDGFSYSHTDNRMWRKTRVPYNIFCYGADPNRNWAYQWNNGGASNVPCSETYAGPHAFSDPSTQVMADYISSIASNLLGYITFHSYSQMLLLSYGHTTEPLDNYDELMVIGRNALEELSVRYGTQYRIGNIAETIYIASGSSMDWVKGTHQTPVTYTYELRDTGTYGFLLPAEQIIPTALETLDSLVSIFSQYRELYPDI